MSTFGNGYQEHRAGIAASMDAAVYDALSPMLQKFCSGAQSPVIRSLLLTAATRHSGVSYLASCAATLTATTFGSTVLIDGQSILSLAQLGRLPTQRDCLAVKGRPLWLFGAIEAQEMLRSSVDSRMPVETVIEAFCRSFDFVVIDAPATATSDTAESLAPFVDGCILIVLPNVTGVRELAEARLKLTARGGKLLGAIYNRNTGDPDVGEQA